jgi:hypothetical protein
LLNEKIADPKLLILQIFSAQVFFLETFKEPYSNAIKLLIPFGQILPVPAFQIDINQPMKPFLCRMVGITYNF